MKLIIEVDKKYYEACKDAVKESYPSQIEEIIANGIPYNSTGDAISREALKKEFGYTDEWYKGRSICNIIDNAPPVEPRIEYGTDGQPYKLSMTNGKEYERPKAKWIEKEETPASVSYYCSNCETEGIPITPFCPWCGADMRGDKE